jgi:hypothetical protein
MNSPYTMINTVLMQSKKIIYGLVHVAKKMRVERQIRGFDKITPFDCSKELPELAKHGWGKTDSTTFFGVSISDLISEYELAQLPNLDEMGNAISRQLSTETISAILSSKALVDVVVAYLGKEARLDDMYLWRKDYGAQGRFDISEGWHTDNVGNRLKVFIGVNTSANAPSTLLIPDTHRTPYKVGVSEFTRFFGKVGEHAQENKAIEIHYQPDTIAIFDTNAVHRGSYCRTSASRTCLVLEFIHRNKGNQLSGSCPCGPGQSPYGRIVFPAALQEMLASHPLIDKNLLVKEGSTLSYSISNISRELNDE